MLSVQMTSRNGSLQDKSSKLRQVWDLIRPHKVKYDEPPITQKQSHLQHENRTRILQKDFIKLEQDIDSLSISNDHAADAVDQTSDLKRSKTVHRGNPTGNILPHEIAARSDSSSLGTSVSSSHAARKNGPSTKGTSTTTENRAADRQLPDVLRCFVSRKYSCTMIGRYLVELLHEGDSFYSGLIRQLVHKNKTYYEICVAVFRVLDLKTEEGLPLEREADPGDWSLRPDPHTPTMDSGFDDPEPVSPSHEKYPGPGTKVRWRFSSMTDEEIEGTFKLGEERTGEAHLMHLSRKSQRSMHIVDSPSSHRTRGEVCQVNDDSTWI